MSLAVDAAGHATHHDEAGCGEVARKRACDRAAVRRARTRADESDGRPVEKRRVHRSAEEEPRGRIVDRCEQRRKRAGRGAGCSGSPSLRRKLSGHPVRESLCNMSGLDRRVARKCGNRSSHPRNAGAPTTRKRKPIDSAREELRGRIRPSRRRAQQPVACVEHACPYFGRCLRLRRRELCRARSRHRDGEVKPIEQGARELLAVRGEPLRRARALDSRIPATAARAHVHGAYELKPRREDRVPADARDRDEPVFERLPKRLENGARELRELVHEQHASMREGDLAGARARPTSHDRRSRRAVVRSPKGRHRHERTSGGKQPADGMDPRHLERLLAAERRENARKPPGEHRLAGPRRAHQQEVVRPGCGDLERPTGALLAAQVGEIRSRTVPDRLLVDRLEGRRERCRPRKYSTTSARCRTATGSIPASAASGADSAAQTRRSSPARRAPSATASVPETGRMRPSSASSPTAGVLGEPLGRQLPRRSENRERDRKIESRSLLPQRRGREIDGDAPVERPLERRRHDAAPHAVLRFLAGAIREADDREARDAGLQVRLDLDPARLEADECVGHRACEHGPTVPGRRSRMVTVFPERELQIDYGV